jgi:putative membrane protein
VIRHLQHQAEAGLTLRATRGPGVFAVVWLAMSAAPSAHGLVSEAAHRWTWEPVTIATLLLSGSVYATGVRQLWRRAGMGRGIGRWQAAAFAGGLLSVAAALLSPIAWLSGILVSVHMTQHEILMLVSAPLLVFGYPLFVFLWALPPRAREACGTWSRKPAVSGLWFVLTGPFTVFLLHGLALWIWHVPSFYGAALANEGIHALEHLSFVVTAALFWWGMVHGRYGRMGYGVSVLYVFLTAIHSSVLGALMTTAPRVLYDAYAQAGVGWHVDALEDQQLAGLLMWVPSGLVFIVLGLALLAAWLGESDKRAALGSVAAATARSPLSAIGGLDDGP